MPATRGTAQDLRVRLRAIDRRGYPAYRDIRGAWAFPDYVLSIDHVQGDPFAAPSSVSVHVPAKAAGFPADLLADPARPLTRRNSVAVADWLLDGFQRALARNSRQVRGSGKSGELSCTRPGEEVLERTACHFDPAGNLTVRFHVGFPAQGRTVLAGALEEILFDVVPGCVEDCLLYRSLPAGDLRAVADLAEDQTSLRDQMAKRGLVAFVADGAILPRASGVSQRPLQEAVPFRSPEEDRVAFDLPHAGRVTGMGIGPGITLVIGGGYHGKSTLLEALERGVYDHVAGDGRELVMADPTTTKVRAEDGRAIWGADISPFIHDLPSGADTRRFSSENASGSTSQAASVVEAVEAGARVLLMDEDTCATNFMVRDDLMARVVAQADEPIVPYSRTMRGLFEACGVSTILVAGSSGAFFSEADRVIQMDRYQPRDVTARVRQVLAEEGEGSRATGDGVALPRWDFSVRTPRADRHALEGPRGRAKHRGLGTDGLSINRETVDLRALAQVVDGEQTELLSCLVLEACSRMDGRTSLQEIVAGLMARLREEGPTAVCGPAVPGNLAEVRPQELFAALDRCRFVR